MNNTNVAYNFINKEIDNTAIQKVGIYINEPW